MDFGGESKAGAGEPAELPPPLSQPPAILDVTELAALAAERSRRQRAEAASRRHVSTSAASAAEEPTAGQWFDQACELEAESRAEAIQAYHRALDLDPGMTDAHVNLGRLYHDGRDPARAEAHYRAAILSAAQDPLPWFNLGVLLEDLGRIPEAVEAYERAIGLDPEHGDAHYNLALLLENLGRKGAALKHLMKARRLSGPPDRS
jgi:tetratricopeptide (TPR) repeat protein